MRRAPIARSSGRCTSLHGSEAPTKGRARRSSLEFFFDLVFVVAIDQLARRLQHGV
jgi:low temperature requirement protein LtrA